MPSKRDILETETMLRNLQSVLQRARPDGPLTSWARDDAESLRRISMTLHRWHELECNEDIQRLIPKRIDGKLHYIVAEESGKPYLVNHDGPTPRYRLLNDRERGALKRLDAIMKNYPTLAYYIQTDPRGCALYIMRPQDLNGSPAGDRNSRDFRNWLSANYSRGIAVHQ